MIFGRLCTEDEEVESQRANTASKDEPPKVVDLSAGKPGRETNR
jgi:hypothetical protein